MMKSHISFLDLDEAATVWFLSRAKDDEIRRDVVPMFLASEAIIDT